MRFHLLVPFELTCIVSIKSMQLCTCMYCYCAILCIVTVQQLVFRPECTLHTQDLTDTPEEALQAVHAYWLTKRTANRRPLLQRLWFEQPWVRAAAKGTKQGPHPGAASDSSDGDDESDDVPFMGRDNDSPAHGWTRARHMGANDVRDVLYSMR